MSDHIEPYRDPTPAPPLFRVAPEELSPRELEVLEGVVAGKSNAEIADSMFLGINTVKTYIRTGYRKIGVTTRAQVVLWGVQHGLLKIPGVTITIDESIFNSRGE